jgi:SAM-dependent methyltransferase
MLVAKKYEEQYWDGDRRYGYGGYKYIPGRWKPVAEALIKEYNLTNQSTILDVGCGKAFLLYEIQLLLPGINITGIDISKHGLASKHPDFKGHLAENIAFDQNAGYGNLDRLTRTIKEAKFHYLRGVYKSTYSNTPDKKFTRYVMINEKTMELIRECVNSGDFKDYKTYRFYFISYCKKNVCEQGHKDQMSVMIVPVSSSGPVYDAFENYLVSKKRFDKATMTLNHGSLCPNYCPDGDY